MQIVVSHLTRMNPGYICVAGLDVKSGKHVRPVLGRRLGTELLRKNGGVFAVGAIVDLGPTSKAAAAPEVEDHQFSIANVKFLRTAKANEFWDAVGGIAKTTFAAIFGPSLISHGGPCAVDVGTGTASLGCLTLPAGSVLEVDPWNKIRMHLDDGTFTPSLSVTDIRLYEDDQKTPREKLITTIARRLKDENVLLSVKGGAKPGQSGGVKVGQ